MSEYFEFYEFGIHQRINEIIKQGIKKEDYYG